MVDVAVGAAVVAAAVREPCFALHAFRVLRGDPHLPGGLPDGALDLHTLVRNVDTNVVVVLVAVHAGRDAIAAVEELVPHLPFADNPAMRLPLD